MGVLSVTQKHVIVLIKVSNVFARYLAWGWQPFVFTKFKARFDDWYFTSFIY